MVFGMFFALLQTERPLHKHLHLYSGLQDQTCVHDWLILPDTLLMWPLMLTTAPSTCYQAAGALASLRGLPPHATNSCCLLGSFGWGQGRRPLWSCSVGTAEGHSCRGSSSGYQGH